MALNLIMTESELAKGRKSIDPECCAGLCLEQATTVKTHPLISFPSAQPPSFSENLGHFFFIITVFPGLCGTPSPSAKMKLHS